MAVAVGVAIGSAAIWIAMGVYARYELRQVTLHLEAETRKLQDESAAELRRQIERRRLAQQRQAEAAEQRRRADAARDRRPLMKQATDAMPVGTLACLYGYQSRRTRDGRWEQLLVAGQAQPCRTG
jgi:hypothetical protein